MNDSKAMLRFRESFRGYNKEDVNAYIEQINARFSRRETELRSQISDMQLNCQQSCNKDETEALKKKLEAVESENKDLLQEIEALKKSFENDSEKSEKSRLYDSMSAQVGNILIVANSNAEKIISNAEAEAEKIRADAHFEAEKIKLSAEQKMDQMIKELDEKLKLVSDSYMGDYSRLISDAQKQFVQITEAIKEKSEKLLSEADLMGKDMGKKISEHFN